MYCYERRKGFLRRFLDFIYLVQSAFRIVLQNFLTSVAMSAKITTIICLIFISITFVTKLSFNFF